MNKLLCTFSYRWYMGNSQKSAVREGLRGNQLVYMGLQLPLFLKVGRVSMLHPRDPFHCDTIRRMTIDFDYKGTYCFSFLADNIFFGNHFPIIKIICDHQDHMRSSRSYA